MSCTILGVDPGVNGAIAVLHAGEELSWHGFADMPTIDADYTYATGGKKLRRRVDPKGLVRLLQDWRVCGVNHAAVEMTSSHGQMGAATVHSMGVGSGIVIGVLEALGYEWHLVPPPVWKRELGLLKAPKDSSRALAVALYPEASQFLKRKKDVDRADALLIATAWWRLRWSK